MVTKCGKYVKCLLKLTFLSIETVMSYYNKPKNKEQEQEYNKSGTCKFC